MQGPNSSVYMHHESQYIQGLLAHEQLGMCKAGPVSSHMF